jgi:hypothetical protein
LGAVHSFDRQIGEAKAGGDFFGEQDAIVGQHKAYRPDDQQEIDAAHPPIELSPQADAAARARSIHVDLALREAIGSAGMTFPAGYRQVRGVNGGTRIGRRENFVDTMTTGAVSRESRPVLGGQAMVAFEKRFYAVRRQIVFGV